MADPADFVEEEEPWCLRLFFSVDLAGSTEFKVSKMNSIDDLTWTLPFQSFYQDFPESFKTSFSNHCNSLQHNDQPTKNEIPSSWKFMGDEILLTAEVRNSKLLPFYLAAFKETLRQCSVDLNEKHGLACKGTVWSAGFPLINRVISNIGIAADYIGPSIDCGFRLTKYATPRYLVISVEVALMAATHLLKDESEQSTWSTCDLRFYFENMEGLKGVLGGRPYPIIWIDTTPKHLCDIEHPEGILKRRSDIPARSIVDFCQYFIRQNPNTLIIPFVNNDRCGEFTFIPQEHKAKLVKLANAEMVTHDLRRRESEPIQPDASPSETTGKNVSNLLSLAQSLLNFQTKKEE